MNLVVLSVLVAAILPIVCAGIAKWGARGYNNHEPRAWLALQAGWRARANAAQQNCFEAFPLFAAGVILASLQGADQEAVSWWCWAFIAMRVLYIYCYVTDRATLRSVAWLLGLIAAIRLYVLAL